jgi:hypothetical protein
MSDIRKIINKLANFVDKELPQDVLDFLDATEAQLDFFSLRDRQAAISDDFRSFSSKFLAAYKPSANKERALLDAIGDIDGKQIVTPT